MFVKGDMPALKGKRKLKPMTEVFDFETVFIFWQGIAMTGMLVYEAGIGGKF